MCVKGVTGTNKHMVNDQLPLQALFQRFSIFLISVLVLQPTAFGLLSTLSSSSFLQQQAAGFNRKAVKQTTAHHLLMMTTASHNKISSKLK